MLAGRRPLTFSNRENTASYGVVFAGLTYSFP